MSRSMTARAFDPIMRYEAWLRATGLADDAFVADCSAEAEAFALEVRAGVVATQVPPVEWMFDWTYAEPPGGGWARQREEALGG